MRTQIARVYNYLPMDTSSSPPAQNRVELGPALREYRLRHRMTQGQMAVRLGVTQQTIARWEKGKPPRPDLVPLIEAEMSRGPTEHPRRLADVIALPAAPAGQRPTEAQFELHQTFMRGCVDI